MKKNTSQHQHLNNVHSNSKNNNNNNNKNLQKHHHPLPQKRKIKKHLLEHYNSSLFLYCATAFGIERLSTDYDLLAFVSQQFFL